ncbi:MAG: histidine--tRNA ligase [Candidatus Berkiellales bacterium]
MSVGIKVVKGMKDVLPTEMGGWNYLENKIKSLFQCYGYQEIRMPVVEQTELFKRAIGEVTDIVEKEMYTFVDKGGDSLTLRPEGTAQCARAVMESGLLRNQSLRLWYFGPMFRRENPQKGRYRQFYQFGIEAFGLPGPDVDVEQLLMMSRLWHQLGLDDKIALQLNSLGTLAERTRYREALVAYFSSCKTLDEDSQRRLNTNPLRILDSKNPHMQETIRNAPSLIDFLERDSLHHFEAIQGMLKQAGVKFEVNPRLVRGLDYYTHTVYEWVTTELGAQGTVCAGGRYNDLVSQLGGQPTDAVGFSLGVERVLMLLTDNQLIVEHQPIDVYMVADGDKAQTEILLLAEKLREAMPSLKILTNCGKGSFKSQFKRADKCGARFAIILGEEELNTHTIGIKALREDLPQQSLSFDQIIAYLNKMTTQKG